ncbi:MAG: histidinol-phosphatase [Candidatus Aenigmarchaeota archaeon ex4484_56]|nr:MAG: histidinol-phosphatase [Candidatus Aenigmarchaeota archaeon ex4484_56]
MIVADFHIHTKYSSDSNLEIRELLDIAEKLGYSALGIVDHNTTKGAIEAKKLSKKILVLVGQEIRTNKGDLIVFGTEKSLKGDIYEILDYVKENSLFSILPHPFDKFRSASICRNANITEIKEIAKRVDAIEIFNSRCLLNRFNTEAKKLSEELGIPKIASSDAHIAEELGNVKNFISCDLDEDEIFKAIRNNKLTFKVKKTEYINYIRKYIKK